MRWRGRLRASRDRMTGYEWAPVRPGEVADWNRRLLSTEAPLYQFPFWLQPLTRPLVRPRFFCCRSQGGALVAYAALLTIGFAGFRIGVLNGGPVSLLPGEPLPDEALRSLWRRLLRSGYVCVRVANATESTCEAVRRTCSSEERDPFPWYPSTDHMLVVDWRESGEEILAGFGKHARQEIKKAAALGYVIEATDSPEAIRTVWPLIEAMEARKGRRIYRRRRESYECLMALARPYGRATVYQVRADGRLVQAILVVLDRTTAHYVIGALDVDALDGAVSPACLVHWTAMQDAFRDGVRNYSLGNDNQGGLQVFKHKFQPRRLQYPPVRTAVMNRALYRMWTLLLSRTGQGR